MKKVKSKKVAEFDIQDLLPIALTIVVAGIGIAYGISVLSDTKEGFGSEGCSIEGGFWNTGSQLCQVSGSNVTPLPGYTNPASYDASVKATEGVAGIATKLPLIVTVIIASIVIGILVRYLFVGGKT